DENRYNNLVEILSNSFVNWNNGAQVAGPISYDPTFGENGLMAVVNMEPDYTWSSETEGPKELTLSMYYSTDKGFNWTTRDSIGYFYTTENDIKTNPPIKYYTTPSMAIVNTNQSQS